jgi:hypothetical protein
VATKIAMQSRGCSRRDGEFLSRLGEALILLASEMSAGREWAVVGIGSDWKLQCS